MTYLSVDELQKTLAKNVFHYTKDSKKAAGRALGTLVEIISFYTLKSWGFEKHIAIERSLPEYMNSDITHNIEYSLHPLVQLESIDWSKKLLPITSTKLLKKSKVYNILKSSISIKANHLLTSKSILRNACTVCDTPNGFVNAYLDSITKGRLHINLCSLHNHPFAIVECKRVGVEEGTKKGPQTIEKAKQGAYVARTVSALQKIRLNNGKIGGVIHLPNGNLYYKEYPILLSEIIKSKKKEFLQDFVLTIGIISNHGNWFTSSNPNKELKVLAQSYDWLLFLTDKGLAQFINDLIQHPLPQYKPIKKAFLESYSGKKGKNQFTKVQIALDADVALQKYFQLNIKKINLWFNVITPKNKMLPCLWAELDILTKKDWRKILK